MPELAGKKITKIYEGKAGDKGQWFNFKVEERDERFSMYVFKGKVAPAVGATIKSMRWEESQSEDGRFTNYNVKQIEFETANTQAGTTPTTGSKQSPVWFALSYMKDIQVARINAGFIDASTTLEEIGTEVVSAALKVLKQIDKE